MSEEEFACSICQKTDKPPFMLFVHCRHCLAAGEMSSAMQLVMFRTEANGTTLEAYCQMCGAPVYSTNNQFTWVNLEDGEHADKNLHEPE